MRRRIKNRDILLKILDAIGDLPPGLLYEHTASGNPATFKTNVAKAMAMEIPFTPVQDLNGYDFPWPPGGYKNIFNIDGHGDGYVSGKWVGPAGAESSYASWSISEYIAVKAETEYTLSGMTLATQVSVSRGGYCFYDDNKDVVAGGALYSDIEETFTIPSGVSYIRISFFTGTDHGNPQLEIGDTATAYAPYSNICPITGFTGCDIIVSPTLDAQDGTTYAVSWSTEAGTAYHGTLTVNKDGSGLLVVDYGAILVDGSNDNPEWWADGKQVSFNLPSLAYYVNTEVSFNCDTFKPCSQSNRPFNVGNYATLVSSGAKVALSYSEWTNLSSATTWLETNNVLFVYALAEPDEYELTAEQIKTLIGTNNVWTDTNETNTIKYMKRG